ncbi:MAG: AAA family ATPase [Crocosphaera sp.]|nr:AAA family ATPase [Crocosphaera sp.]
MGIQASGKSTFYQDRFSNTHLRINLDMLKTRYREKRLIETCLEISQRFVVDNTNPTAVDRERYIRLLKNQGWKITGYYFKPNINDSVERNQKRQLSQQVPIKGIRGTYSRLIVPQYQEGFDQLYCVEAQPEKKFIVHELINEV